MDATGKADGEAVDVEDSRLGSPRPGHTLAPLDIVLVRTGRDAFYGQPDYIARGPAVTAAATLWLFEHGRARDGHRRVGLGRPAALPGRGGQAGRRPGVFWAAHQADLPYSQIERLFNLGAPPDRLPGRLLPAEDRGRERGAGAGRGDTRRLVL